MSPDGEAIVTGAGDETLRFWNVFSKTRSTKVKWVGITSSCSPMRVPSACPGDRAPSQAALFTLLAVPFLGSPRQSLACWARCPHRAEALASFQQNFLPCLLLPGWCSGGGARGPTSAAPPMCPAGVRVSPQPIHQDPVNLGPRCARGKSAPSSDAWTHAPSQHTQRKGPGRWGRPRRFSLKPDCEPWRPVWCGTWPGTHRMGLRLPTLGAPAHQLC